MRGASRSSLRRRHHEGEHLLHLVVAFVMRCVHAASKSYCVTEKACSVADSPTFATRQAEGGKLKKYGHLCAVRGHILLPIVLNTYGGFGDEIMKIVNKYFDAKRAEEKATTSQE